MWNFLFFIYPHSRVTANEPFLAALETGQDFNPKTAWLAMGVYPSVPPGKEVWMELTAAKWIFAGQTRRRCCTVRTHRAFVSDKHRIEFFRVAAARR